MPYYADKNNEKSSIYKERAREKWLNADKIYNFCAQSGTKTHQKTLRTADKVILDAVQLVSNILFEGNEGKVIFLGLFRKGDIRQSKSTGGRAMC